jgi:hypothetical protein
VSKLGPAAAGKFSVGGWFLVLASRSFCLRLRGISFQFSAAFVLVFLRFFLFACRVSFCSMRSFSHAICALGSTRICALVFSQQKVFGGVVFGAVVVLRSCKHCLSASFWSVTANLFHLTRRSTRPLRVSAITVSPRAAR